MPNTEAKTINETMPVPEEKSPTTGMSPPLTTTAPPAKAVAKARPPGVNPEDDLEPGAIFVRECPECSKLHQTIDSTAKRPCRMCRQKTTVEGKDGDDVARMAKGELKK